MYLTGFADAAAAAIDGQIRATRELGWKHIEARNVGGKNRRDISDGECDRVREPRKIFNRGYDGGFSIEPHMAVVLHGAAVSSADEVKYRNYVEYGRRFERLAREVRSELSQA